MPCRFPSSSHVPSNTGPTSEVREPPYRTAPGRPGSGRHPRDDVSGDQIPGVCPGGRGGCELKIRRALDTRGQTGPLQHALLVARRQPHAVIVMLDCGADREHFLRQLRYSAALGAKAMEVFMR